MTRPTNLIFFLSDNHNARVMGNAGHPVVQTPTLDRIAEHGARFTAGYCASTLCCPSRAAIATGRFPHQTGYWDNCLAYDGRVASFGHRVREAGGTAVSVGKLHFRSTEDDNGFDEEIAPMHILGGHGSLTHLLRWNGEMPPIPGQWDLYWKESGIGETEYQEYDREISRLACQWLRDVGSKLDRPWVLLVSYVSSHPPFKVPKRLFDLYPEAQMPLPIRFRPEERPMHPALEHLRTLKVYQAMDDESRLRRIAAGYFGLVTHLDEQIGEVMAVAEAAGVLDRTRVLYTSDHGESCGNHGLFGKNHLLETAARVPLLLSGPGITAGTVIRSPVSSTDLFPTIVQGAGAEPDERDGELPGRSLWPEIEAGSPPPAVRRRPLFAEFHAAGSINGSFLWRRGPMKLIYHVGMPSQLYDLEADPDETRDLVDTPQGQREAQALEAELRAFVDPEAVDARAKSDQREMAERFGGTEAIRGMGTVVYTPPPGREALMDPSPG